MARTTTRKDSLASFVWTVGAADMVIGGVGERGSLFTFGLLTVGAGVLVGWLRQRRLDNMSLPKRSRGASAFLAQQARSVRLAVGPRTRRRGGAGVRRGAPSYYAGRPTAPPLRRPSGAQAPSQPGPVSRPVSVSSERSARSERRSPQISSDPQLQGPPLNLPPAPRPRRGRRIY